MTKVSAFQIVTAPVEVHCTPLEHAVDDTLFALFPNTPVVELYVKSPPDTERDVVVILELNVANDEDERNPEVPNVAVAILKVQAPEEDEI